MSLEINEIEYKISEKCSQTENIYVYLLSGNKSIGKKEWAQNERSNFNSRKFTCIDGIICGAF